MMDSSGGIVCSLLRNQAISRSLAISTYNASNDPLGAVSDQVAQIASKSARPELSERLVHGKKRLADRAVRVILVGEVKQGKSALVNSLVGASVCPVDDVYATSVPTIVSYGSEPAATVITEPTPGKFARQTVPPQSLRARVTDEHDTGALRPVRAEVQLPSPGLAQGLVLIDTPGVGGAGIGNAASTLALLPTADAALMLSDATQELTKPELDFAQQAASMCPRLTAVLSKTDLQLEWREIREANAGHLLRAGVDAEILPTSSLLHELGRHEQDSSLLERSGVPQLTRTLNDNVRVDVITERRRVVADEITSVANHLLMSLDSELQALQAPSGGGNIVRSLEDAKAASKALSKRTARWQQTLTDGIADLHQDVDFDLRDRLRSVLREAEELIDQCDPAADWQGFGEWFADALAKSIADNFVWANQRAEHLAVLVADHFTIEGKVAMPEFSMADTDGILRSVAGLEAVDANQLTLGQKFFVGVRGSYSGVLMVGLITSLAGLALVNPFSIAAGLLLGGYAYRQDASQQLQRRRAEAKTAVRRLIDDAIFKVAKESRDRLNRVKRVIRDHFTEVAEELSRTFAESVESARRGSSTPPDKRGARIAELTARQNELRALCAQADTHVIPAGQQSVS